MELGLSLGSNSLGHHTSADNSNHDSVHSKNKRGFQICMGLSIHSQDDEDIGEQKPFKHIDDFLSTSHQMIKDDDANYSFSNPLVILSMVEGDGGPGVAGSPNSATSSFGISNRRSLSVEEEDEVSGNSCRKKLRLSRDQSAFLEERFKEHSTLNPKQKLALAKQLNLRPRQVEVWFQNRRARTKLKQTEVDCELLKKCCETLTEENRRLHKELQDLRALESSSISCVQSPATTLTMCPSCESTSTMAANATKTASTNSISQITAFPAVTKTRTFYPFRLSKTITSPTSSSA